VLREHLLQVRAKTHMKSRRPDRMPTALPLTLIRRGTKQTRLLPLDSHLTLMFMPIFPPPAFLEGRRQGLGIELVGLVTVQVGGPSLQDLVESTQTRTFSATSTWKPVSFARLVAKVAYGMAVAQLGLEAIGEAYVVPSILGKSEDIGRWVGCPRGGERDPVGNLHTVDLRVERGMIVARVRLFSSLRTPDYLVVVGRIREPEKSGGMDTAERPVR